MEISKIFPKGPFFSQTVKVKGKKVPLVLKIFAQGLRYSLFLIFCQQHQQGAITKFRKRDTSQRLSQN